MQKWLLAILASVVLPAVANANIGDDLSQLRARYGSAKQVGGQMLFQHDGYSICVYFDDVHSAMEVFVRDGSKPDKTDITQADIDQILAAESDGFPWAQAKSQTGKPTWLRADGKLIARLATGENPGDKFLTIMVNAK
jgi:hypothetical protein